MVYIESMEKKSVRRDFGIFFGCGLDLENFGLWNSGNVNKE